MNSGTLRDESSNSHIGLGVVSFNRPGALSALLKNLDQFGWGGAQVRVVVVDEPYDEFKYGNVSRNGRHVVLFKENGGMGSAKNLVLDYLLANDCKHIFIIEDDILMSSRHVCEHYTEYAIKAGVPHLNFALHGPLNNGQGRWLQWKRDSNIGMDRVWVFPHCVGAFSYYTNDIINLVGKFDENFYNAWEHVEHTWRITLTKQTPPFWYFMDHPESDNFLTEIRGALSKSVIRASPKHHHNIRLGKAYWIEKHGQFLPPKPVWA